MSSVNSKPQLLREIRGRGNTHTRQPYSNVVGKVSQISKQYISTESTNHVSISEMI